jgi:hypothetical protein
MWPLVVMGDATGQLMAWDVKEGHCSSLKTGERLVGWGGVGWEGVARGAWCAARRLLAGCCTVLREKAIRLCCSDCCFLRRHV